MADDKMGACWTKSATMMTGESECPHCKKKTRIVMFANSRKEKETQPDWNMLVSRPRTDTPAPAETSEQDAF